MWGVWLPVLGYVALIFGLSSIPNLDPPHPIENTDKIAHLTEYGILGMLLFRAVSRTLGRKRAWMLVAAVAVGASLAALDEVYQGTVGRDQSLADWIADLIGLTAGGWIIGWFLPKRRKKKTAAKAESLEKQT